MRKKIIMLFLLVLAVSSLGACKQNNKIDFVDYSFSEYTEPPTQKSTKKPTETTSEHSSEKTSEKTSEKSSEHSTAKVTEVPTQKPTEKATKKKKDEEVVINNRPSEEMTQKPTQAPEPETVPTQAPVVPTEAPTTPPTQPPIVTTADDIKFMYNGYTLTLDADFNAVAGGLGTPDDKIESHRSTLSDEEYIYTYSNMQVHTYVKDGVERIEDVRVDGIGNASTAKGIVVGNPVSYVKSMYGKPTSEDTVILKYKVDNQLIIFYLAGDRTTISGFAIVREK